MVRVMRRACSRNDEKLESRVRGNPHARFGEGRSEKERTDDTALQGAGKSEANNVTSLAPYSINDKL
jgi:hypothetical protein